jgi:hypothetical protein
MFSIDCPGHGHRVLVPSTRIRSFHNTGAGILLTLECWCGTQVPVRTGRLPARAAARIAVS